MKDADPGKSNRGSIWMHDKNSNVRVHAHLIEKAYEQGFIKGYAPGTHPNFRKVKK